MPCCVPSPVCAEHSYRQTAWLPYDVLVGEWCGEAHLQPLARCHFSGRQRQHVLRNSTSASIHPCQPLLQLPPYFLSCCPRSRWAAAAGAQLPAQAGAGRDRPLWRPGGGHSPRLDAGAGTVREQNCTWLWGQQHADLASKHNGTWKRMATWPKYGSNKEGPAEWLQLKQGSWPKYKLLPSTWCRWTV